jgi:hypothetical protein
VLSSAQFYRRGKRQCDDLFPQKKVPFCFIHPHDLDAGSRGQKVGSLKDFEIRSVLKKEPLCNGQKLSTRSTCSFARSKEGKFLHKCPIMLSIAVPDQHSLEHNVRSEDIKK